MHNARFMIASPNLFVADSTRVNNPILASKIINAIKTISVSEKKKLEKNPGKMRERDGKTKL